MVTVPPCEFERVDAYSSLTWERPVGYVTIPKEGTGAVDVVVVEGAMRAGREQSRFLEERMVRNAAAGV